MRTSLLFLLLLPALCNAQVSVPDTSHVFYSLETALQNPDAVYKLNLGKKKLKIFPVEVFQFRNLRELDLSKNKIREIPGQIETLKDLRSLNVSSNKIQSLPGEIGNLQSLVVLKLSRNIIDSLPPSIGKLQNLEVLDLWDNEIDSIPEEISKLSHLKVFELRGILFTDEEQTRIKTLLPNTKIYFSPSCNCK